MTPLQRLFESLYRELAPAYDLVARIGFAGEWHAWQQCVLPHLGPRPIVELGCGTGHLQALLRTRGEPAIGVDRSPAMLRQARRRANRRLLLADARSLPLADASVGTLVSVFPSEYILQAETWREAHRVLRPGGRFAIVLHGWLAPDSPRRWLLARAHRLIYGPPSEGLAFPLETAGFVCQQRSVSSPHGGAVLLLATKTDG